MAIFETWLKSDFQHAVQVVQLRGNLFSADNEGNLIGVEVFDGGEAATLSGSVFGYLIRADGATVTVEGTLSGNKASIVLPTSAYAVVGQISIVIKLGTVTLGACVAHVYRTTTDTIVDPGHVIPSIAELLEKISACEAATVAAMKVANLTVSAEAASGTPTATLSEVGSGSSAHKHITFGLIPGQDGTDGVSPTVTVTTITGGHRVTITDGSGDHTYDVLDGTDGVSPTIVVSEITGGHQIAVTDASGTTTFNVLDGQDGVDGQDGEDGADGTDAYVWIRYAANQPTQDSDMTTTPSDWMGVYSGSASSAPTSYTSYAWYKVKGETGQASNVYGNTIPMSSSDSTKVSEAIAAKYTKPSGGIPGTDLASGVIPGDMTGASSSAAGTHGLVPAPAAGDEGKFLRGDGAWQNVPNPQVMTGATASAAGTSGLVPAPAAGDQDKVLTGDGNWTAKTGANIPMSGTDSTPVKDAIEAIANVVAEIPLTIEPSDWDSSSPYSFEWVDNRVLSDSSVEVEILSAESGLLYLNYEKSSGGGGIVFTPSSLPTDDVSVLIVITNARAHSGSSIDADTVATDAVSGASNVDEALTALSAKFAISTKDITTITNATGTVRFSRSGNVVQMMVDITPSDSSSSITFSIPNGFLSNGPMYDKRNIQGSNIYTYLYANNATVTISHTSNAAIVLNITYIGA